MVPVCLVYLVSGVSCVSIVSCVHCIVYLVFLVYLGVYRVSAMLFVCYVVCLYFVCCVQSAVNSYLIV